MDQLHLTASSLNAYERMVSAAIALADRPDLLAAVEELRATGAFQSSDVVGIAESDAPSEKLAEALAQMMERLHHDL